MKLVSIDLRLSNVDPSLPEPHRTIYRDINSLPTPALLGITIRAFNYDNVGLYMQITGSGAGYTFGTTNLGLLASGANLYKNLDQFASRTTPTAAQLPAGELQETILLTLNAYTDSGYTSLKWTFTRTVTVYWINSSDPAFTVNNLDNFDDATVDGWAVANETYPSGGSGLTTVAIATDYVLSPLYSCKMTAALATFTVQGEYRNRIYKSFTTPNKSKVFAIIDMRVTQTVGYAKYVEVQINHIAQSHIGNIYDGGFQDNFTYNKWMRIVIPLTVNTTLEIECVLDCVAAAAPQTAIIWLDDFKIISK